MHASQLDGGGLRPDIAIVLEATSAVRHSSLLLPAYGLTRAHSRVVELVLQGCSTRHIMAELHIPADLHSYPRQNIRDSRQPFGIRQGFIVIRTFRTLSWGATW